jgi:hypothetical protein
VGFEGANPFRDFQRMALNIQKFSGKPRGFRAIAGNCFSAALEPHPSMQIEPSTG